MIMNFFIGVLIGIVFGVPVGVIGILTIQRTMAGGAKAGLISGLGSSTADIIYAAIGCMGTSFISSFLIRNEKVINVFGSVLIVCIGLSIIFKEKKFDNKDDKASNLVSYFISSFVINITNPIAIFGFATVFTSFGIVRKTSSIGNILLILGIFIGSYLWWILIAIFFTRFKGRITEKQYGKISNVFGVLIIILGVILVLK